jgi:hypothetical protein
VYTLLVSATTVNPKGTRMDLEDFMRELAMRIDNARIINGDEWYISVIDHRTLGIETSDGSRFILDVESVDGINRPAT